MKVKSNGGVFHVQSPEDFFSCLEVALNRYEASIAKRVEDVFFY